jgi:hypothetical protein
LRDYSIDNDMVIQDTSFKQWQPILDLILEKKPNFAWNDVKQLEDRWANMLGMYWKVKNNNATTGQSRQVDGFESVIDDMIPRNHPKLLGKRRTDRLSDSEDCVMQVKRPKSRWSSGNNDANSDPIGMAIAQSLLKDAESGTNENDVKIAAMNTKSKLFASFTGRSIEEIKELLKMYQEFENNK